MWSAYLGLLKLGSQDRSTPSSGLSYSGGDGLRMCGFYPMRLLARLPGPQAQLQLAGWFVMALFAAGIAPEACCPPCLCTTRQCSVGMLTAWWACQSAGFGPFRPHTQSTLAWRLWYVGRPLRFFPRCREAAGSQVDVDLLAALAARRLPPLRRLCDTPMEYCGHVMDPVFGPQSVGYHMVPYQTPAARGVL